ncbi:MAG: tryptophan synthase subunit beta [Brevinema sp.]
MSKVSFKNYSLPDENGFFGEFGGAFVPEPLQNVLKNLTIEFEKAVKDPTFFEELNALRKDYTGRPSPLYFAQNLSNHYGINIYLKREDLNHTGSHKINNTLGQALLAKRMGMKKIVAETGAGQHGLATATVCALMGMECLIFMGEEDIKRQQTNVDKMKMLGARVESVSTGDKCLTAAVDAALGYYVTHADDTFYLLGSAVGPHPYPKMVRTFQRIIGEEARAQFLEKTGKLPDAILACVGGGSNAIGLFSAFLADEDVRIFGAEAGGKGLETGRHCASITAGIKTEIHGFRTYVLEDTTKAYSISAGLDYPGVGPEISYLSEVGRATFVAVKDDQAIEAFKLLSSLEGIIPAIESAHAIAAIPQVALAIPKNGNLIINLSGRGDKDAARLNH